MDTIMDLAKAETLEAMYRSLGRMNQAIIDGNHEIYQSEVGLQQNLRSNFEELLGSE
jgi:hypothetical protein